MDPSAELFVAARDHEHELSARQREVFKLIAAGLANREIAERLGISLDGAKWNVSEILTKLGLATREEAAAYWAWRNSTAVRAGRLVRGLWSVPALKWAAGPVAILAVAVVAWWVWQGRSDDRVGPGDSFELKISYER